MNNVLTIAKNEFSILIRSPIVITFGVLMFILALLNAAGCSAILPANTSLDHTAAFMVGIRNFFWILSMLFAFLSMCVGMISIANDRSKGSLRVLLTKPLYRRDVISGKFIGISLFLLMVIAFTITLFVSLIMVVFGGPESIIDLTLRMAFFSILLFLNSSFTLGLVMFLGTMINRLEALVISISYISIEWLATIGSLPYQLGNLRLIDPGYLYYYTVCRQSNILDPNTSIGSWLSGSSLYIVLMVAETILIVLINSILFIRKEI